MTFGNAHTKPSVKLSGNTLVLSLPDAMTPVVWMMDMKETGSFFMRVEQDDNGLYILQKITGTGKDVAIEDVAYYSDKKSAISAMTMIGKVIDSGKSSSHSDGGIGKILFKVIGTLAILAALFVILLIAIGSGWINIEPDNEVVTTSQNAAPAEEAPAPPTVNSNTNAVGVPLSADDYLKEQNRTSGLPF